MSYDELIQVLKANFQTPEGENPRPHGSPL